MANEADKKRAQQLVNEALQQHHKAKSKHEKRQWAETHLPLLEQAISLDPDNYKAWAGRGTAKSQLGDLEGAIEDLDEAIARNRDNDDAWTSLGVVKIALKKYEDAIKDFDEAIKLNPKNYDALGILGAVKYSLGDFAAAISDFRKAIELNPKNDAIRQNLEAAEIAFASQKYAEKPQKEKEEYHKHLKERARSHKLKFNILIILKWLLFICIITIIFIFIVMFAILFLLYVYGGSVSALRQAIGELNFFTLWPYFMLMFVCLMPFFVMLRLNIQDAKRELILKEDFHGRYIVELYLERFSVQNKTAAILLKNISLTGCITTHQKPYYGLIKNHRINLTPRTSTSCVN